MIEWIGEKFEAGGFFMYPILAVSAFGIAIIFERWRVIRGASSINKEELLNHINSYILQGKIDKALSVTSQIKSPLTNIVRAGLVSVMNGKNEEEVQTAMDAVALREIPVIEKRIPLLFMMSNLATLLGLLGTVTGMIGAFAAVANVSPSEKATLLAGAIAEAMNCTAFGLLVAIPMLGIYGMLQSWAQSVVDDIHEASVATLNFILSNRDKIAG